MTAADRLAVEALERELRHVLSETPSAAFLAGVRRRCAEPQRASAWWLPWCVGGGVAALSLAVLVVISVRARSERPPVARSQTAGTASPSAPSNQSAAVAERPGVADNQAKAGRAPGAVVIVGRAVSASAHRRTTSAGPEVLVPPGQLEAVRRLVETLHGSAIETQPMQLAEVVPTVPRLSDMGGAGVVADRRASGINPGEGEGRERNR